MEQEAGQQNAVMRNVGFLLASKIPRGAGAVKEMSRASRNPLRGREIISFRRARNRRAFPTTCCRSCSTSAHERIGPATAARTTLLCAVKVGVRGDRSVRVKGPRNRPPEPVLETHRGVVPEFRPSASPNRRRFWYSNGRRRAVPLAPPCASRQMPYCLMHLGREMLARQ